MKKSFKSFVAAGLAGVMSLTSTIGAFAANNTPVYELNETTEVLNPTKNGSILAAQQRLNELSNNMNELLRLATTPESSKTAMADIQKFSDEMKALREFVETEKSKAATAEQDTEQMNMVLERLEQQEFTLTEYDDVVVRQIVDKIAVVDKFQIQITFKGGFVLPISL